MPVPRLPTEIVLRILDLVNPPSSDLKLLQSCSLVCKAWSAHAQKALFHSVSISAHRQYTALVAAFQPHTSRGNNNTMMVHELHLTRTLSQSSIAGIPTGFPTLNSAYSDILRGSVVELNVIIDFNQHGGLTFTELSQIVTLCPNLRRIGISVFGMQPQGGDAAAMTNEWRMKRLAPPIPNGVLEELRTAPNASRISELRFNDWSDGSEVLFQLLSLWPHITSLKIAGKLPTINNGINSAFSVIPHDATPCALETLSLNCTTGAESNIDFIKWLLKGSQRTLRRLEFLKEPSGKIIEDVFIRSAFPLESVYLPSCVLPSVGQIIRYRLGPTTIPASDGDSGSDGNHAFPQVQGLKEVFVEDPSTPLKFLVSAVRSGTVQRFGFGVDDRTDLSSIARAIKARTGLKRILVWVCNGGERNFGLRSLRIACGIRGIELEETRDVREFRVWKP